MIHYTLLPEKEITDLKREYHTRIFIVLTFFISCVIVAGIIFIFPSYIISHMRQDESNQRLQQMEKEKKVSGVDLTINNLKQSNDILKEVVINNNQGSFADVVRKFLDGHPASIKFVSFQIANIADEKDAFEITVQGKALSREALLEYKKIVSNNPLITKLEFPLPDLTKNKDITFAIKLRMKK
jgi:lipopolysaccharide export LptBFGC system permease protein LptF